MELGEFEIWLSGVSRLNLAQRRRALSALSEVESEPARAVEVASAEAQGSDPSESSQKEPVEARTAEASDPSEVETVATIVHRKVEIKGCPHCASGKIAAWGQARAVSQQSESRGDSPIAFVVIERSRLRRQSRFEFAVNFVSVRGQNVAMR